jgi:dTDP-4-dehydrorhamnose reductase
MLGTELSLVLEQRGLAYIGTDRAEVDITDRIALDAFGGNLAKAGPVAWIINCAAYTAVDRAEDEGETCRALNADGPGNIAAAAQKLGARLLHFSTDYVFNGKGNRPYREDDPADPIGVYGLTKRDGELQALEGNEATYIIRTAWLYRKYGNNFVHTMLHLMGGRAEVRVVNDQRGSPTWACDLADTAADLITAAESNKALPFGIYHYTNEGAITWYGFAREIYAQGRKQGILTRDCAVTPCTSGEFPAKVARPAYSVLDKSKIQAALGMGIPRWDASLERYLKTCGN